MGGVFGAMPTSQFGFQTDDMKDWQYEMPSAYQGTVDPMKSMGLGGWSPSTPIRSLTSPEGQLLKPLEYNLPSYFAGGVGNMGSTPYRGTYSYKDPISGQLQSFQQPLPQFQDPQTGKTYLYYPGQGIIEFQSYRDWSPSGQPAWWSNQQNAPGGLAQPFGGNITMGILTGLKPPSSPVGNIPHVMDAPASAPPPTAAPLATDYQELNPFIYSALFGLGPPPDPTLYSTIQGLNNLYQLIGG